MNSDTFASIMPTFIPDIASLWPVAVAGVTCIVAITFYVRRSRNPAFRARSLAARGATAQSIAQRLRMSRDVAALAAHRGRAAAPAMKLLPARASASSYPAPVARRAPRMSLSV